MEVQSVSFWIPGKALSPEYRRAKLTDNVVLYKELLPKKKIFPSIHVRSKLQTK